MLNTVLLIEARQLRLVDSLQAYVLIREQAEDARDTCLMDQLNVMLAPQAAANKYLCVAQLA